MNEVGENNGNIIIYNTDDWKSSVSLYSKNWDVWMNQNQIAELFDTSKQNISLHIINIEKEWELSQETVVKDYLTTASDWKKWEILLADKKDMLELDELEKNIKNIKK